MKKKQYLQNKISMPIGKDDKLYFVLLDKYKKYIGGVYIGWPEAPSGRFDAGPSRKFFNQIYKWCIENGKVFNIVFNMEPHDFRTGFQYDDINLSPYRNKLTELTFASTFLLKQDKFKNFKKNISVRMRISNIQQMFALNNDNPNINSIVLDSNINRDSKLFNRISEYNRKIGIQTVIMANEGCVPFCPNNKDHAVFGTLAYFSDQTRQIGEMTKVCLRAYAKGSPDVFKGTFITREALQSYDFRFIKICDRRVPPSMLADILEYYIFGKAIDFGVAFVGSRRKVGITTDMLPDSFHRKIINCKNECYQCNHCEKTYEAIIAGQQIT